MFIMYHLSAKTFDVGRPLAAKYLPRLRSQPSLNMLALCSLPEDPPLYSGERRSMGFLVPGILLQHVQGDVVQGSLMGRG